MFNLILKLFAVITPSQKKRFFALQILLVLMALLEILSVASFIPFMTLVGDIDSLRDNMILSNLFYASGLDSEIEFLILIGAGVLLILFISSLISMFSVWRLSIFANKVGTEIADMLYKHYLRKDWLFHAKGSSSQLTKKIATETMRLTNSVLVPLMQMNARIVVVTFLCVSIFIYDPKVSIIGLIIFASTYIVLYKFVRNRLMLNGQAVSNLNEERFRLMSEGFGGIRDILLLGREHNFIKSFSKSGEELALSQGTNLALAQVPRYFIELAAFGAMVGMVMYQLISYEGDFSIILPIISFYAVAAVKLLPAFQNIYTSVANIKGNIAAFESIEPDLHELSANKKEIKLNQKPLFPKKQISLDKISFSYPGKSEFALNRINISIPVNSITGIVGPSGSGKSTLIDIFLGLLKPDDGTLIIDNSVLNNENLRSWQDTIGFVSQSIFLSEGTIAENIAFGIPSDQINFMQVEMAIKQAHLSELINSLEEGVNTKVGERGVQLSGGQRQRVGIARALYHDTKVLVFDEATSSLDGITEKNIMNAISDLSDRKTVILIAHRLKTVEKCDQIFFIDQGKLVDSGSYSYLIENNEHFRNMARNA